MAETDLISRQAAIDALGEKPLAWTEGEYELGLQNQWQSDVDALNDLPSAQPEIIRCKECLWRIGRDCTRFTDLPVYMDDYCGRAKRRGEQDETD